MPGYERSIRGPVGFGVNSAFLAVIFWIMYKKEFF